MRAFGGDPDAIATAARRPDEVLAYVEAHIEQGPVLEAEDLGVGVVTGINGASRFIVRVGGTANHAGTVPMKLRRDALAGAAEMVLAVERRGLEGTDLVATVGRIEALPGAVNVIPGSAVFTIDLRSPDDAARHAASAAILGDLEAIAGRRGLSVTVEQTHDAPATLCAPRLDRATVGGGRPLRRAAPAVAERRRARRHGRGGAVPGRHAVHPLPGRHQPQPGGVHHG